MLHHSSPQNFLKILSEFTDTDTSKYFSNISYHHWNNCVSIQLTKKLQKSRKIPISHFFVIFSHAKSTKVNELMALAVISQANIRFPRFVNWHKSKYFHFFSVILVYLFIIFSIERKKTKSFQKYWDSSTTDNMHPEKSQKLGQKGGKMSRIFYRKNICPFSRRN